LNVAQNCVIHLLNICSTFVHFVQENVFNLAVTLLILQDLHP